MAEENREFMLNGYANLNRGGFTQSFVNPDEYIDMSKVITEESKITIHSEDLKIPGKEKPYRKTYTCKKGFNQRKIFNLINDFHYSYVDKYDLDDDDVGDLTIIGFDIVGTNVYPKMDS